MKSVKNLQGGFIKYHGCGLYRRDGTNILVMKKRLCKFPITNCFWMDSVNIKSQIRTRFRECNNKDYLLQYSKLNIEKKQKPIMNLIHLNMNQIQNQTMNQILNQTMNQIQIQTD